MASALFFVDPPPRLLLLVQDYTAPGLLTLFLIFVSAKLLAEIFQRLKQPAVVGEILAGILIGPGVLRLVTPNDVTAVLAEVGVVFLLFSVGLETRPSDLFRVGKTAALVAVLGVIVPFVLGYALVDLTAYRLLGSHTRTEAIFIGAAMVATSVGITARVLSDMGLLYATTSRIILGAAVIDDVLGLLVLSVVSSLTQGHINYAEIATTIGLAVGFTLFLTIVGARLVNQLTPRVEGLQLRTSYYAAALALCLGLALVASFIGVAAIIGAFLAGVMLAERSRGTRLLHQSEALLEFLAPFFFVNIGMQLELETFLNAGVLLMAVSVTAVAIIGKWIGCGLAALNHGWRGAAQVGVGMMPRGEVGIVVAQIGLSLHTLSNAMYGVVVFMSIATTLLAPPFLRRLFKGEPGVRRAEPSDRAIEIE